MSRDVYSEKAVLAYPHGDRLHPAFARSLAALVQYDALNGRRLVPGQSFAMVQTTNLPNARNQLVRTFLEGTDADWLWFIDTDQDFEPDTLERLILSADPVERPILSGLVYAKTSNRALPVTPAPVEWDGTDFRHAMTVPAERFWPVGCAGSGCLLIHRSVLETVGAKHSGDAFPWFKYSQHDRQGKPDMMGEDFTFSLRAAACGFPIVVDTTIECGHVKEETLRSQHFWAQVPPDLRPRKTWAVVPVKDQYRYTSDLLKQLAREDGVEVVVVDNGSGKKTRNYLESQTIAHVIDGRGLGIHEMWNLGWQFALSRSPAGADIAFLNNDIRLGDGCVTALASELRAHDGLTIVCPNYDGRQIDGGLEFRSDICGERYDGTGGIGFFCFAVPGEWFGSGYRFPENLKWWYGDNHLLMSVLMAGGQAAITGACTVEHLDGGGRTGDWSDPEMQVQLAKDRASFEAMWSGGGVPSGWAATTDQPDAGAVR